MAAVCQTAPRVARQGEGSLCSDRDSRRAGRRLRRPGFERIWAIVDDEQAPEVEIREVSYPKLVLALLLEGAIFRLVKGMVDRGARVSFASLTGRWPGEEEADPST
jgi:hypothetical protein